MPLRLTTLAGAFTLGLVVASMPAYAQGRPEPAPSVAEMLAKAGSYAEQFRSDFRTIIGEERSQQAVRRSQTYRGPRTRRLESEIFFTPVGEPARFMTVRSTTKVDGRSMSGAHERVLDALAPALPATRDERLRALAAEGARFNLGPVGRTFNDPTLALMFLTSELRSRFDFAVGDPGSIGGQRVRWLQFREVTTPSLIRDERDNLEGAVRGSIAVADTGRVLETNLVVAIGSHVEARVRVRYALQPALGMWLPASMDEDYRSDDGAGMGMTLIACASRYSGYRRFETSARVLPQ